MRPNQLLLLALLTALALVVAACGGNTPTPPVTHTLNVTVEGNGSGGVTFNPAGTPAAPSPCTDDCTKTYNAGTPVTLTATPAANNTATWSGDCTVNADNTCSVTMNAAKRVTVTFTASGNGEDGVTSVAIAGGNRTLAPGDTATLTANVVVTGNAAQTVTWSSSNPAVATVNATTGMVTAVAVGTTTITATSTFDNSKTGTITVTVSEDAPPVLESISIDQGETLSLGVGDTETLTVTASPAGAAQGVTWQSSNPAVATVTADTGLVTAVAVGSATVTATSTADASKTDTITVNVTGNDGNRLAVTFLGSGAGEVFVDGQRITQTTTLPFAPDRTIQLQLPTGSTAVAWGGDCGTVKGSPLPNCTLTLDTDKNVSISFPGSSAQTVDVRIVANSVDPVGSSSNDAEEFTGVLANNGQGQSFPEGHMLLTSSILNLTYDPRGTGVDQVVGLRFPNLNIPQGATILNAYLQFRSSQSSLDDNALPPLTLTFKVQDSVNAGNFTNILRNISTRPTHSSSVSWTPPAWAGTTSGAAQQTPNLTPLVQALVSKPAWDNTANSIVFIISSNDTLNRRDAQSFDSNPAGAPQLVIVYEMP